MINFFRRLRSSHNFMNRVADEIGVERGLFKTSLTEMKVNFSQYEEYFLSKDLHMEEQVRLKRISMLLILYARLGAAKLAMRFGNQPQIEDFVFKMIEYQQQHIDLVDDPDAYRSNSVF